MEEVRAIPGGERGGAAQGQRTRRGRGRAASFRVRQQAAARTSGGGPAKASKRRGCAHLEVRTPCSST
eukprot:scaffold1650_cov124-Isochrysis_galbana.AAC.8